jgi:PAS domain S-box-containing protein
MTTTPTPSGIAEILRQSPYPLIAFDVDSLTILGANEAASELVGRDSRSLAGVPTTDLMAPVDARAAQDTWELLVSGAMESYRGIRRIRRPDGTELMVDVWVRLVTIAGSRFGLAIAPAPGAVHWPIDANIRIALAVTDHDWTIEHVSNDIAHVLGRKPDTYEGLPLLGLLQPADAQDFMSALGRLAAGEVEQHYEHTFAPAAIAGKKSGVWS